MDKTMSIRCKVKQCMLGTQSDDYYCFVLADMKKLGSKGLVISLRGQS